MWVQPPRHALGVAAAFIASSGPTVGKPNSIFWNVSAYMLSPHSTVPEPENRAVMMAGHEAVGMTMRRRSRVPLHHA